MRRSNTRRTCAMPSRHEAVLNDPYSFEKECQTLQKAAKGYADAMKGAALGIRPRLRSP